MTRTSRASLAQRLADRYVELRDLFTRRLGSSDRATDALHDTWLRLNQGEDLAAVANADAYLYRAVLNSALKQTAKDRRQGLLDSVEISTILSLADDAPDPERVAIAKNEIAALKRSLASLTRRQRTIFLEVYVGEASPADLAARYKVSVRTVQTELRTALLHVMTRFAGENSFAKESFKVSRSR